MIPKIYFYDKSMKYYKATYYEKSYIQTAYYSYETLVASTHQDINNNTYLRLHLDPDSYKYSNTTAKHIKEMLGFDKKQYRKEWEMSQKREAELQNSPNCHIDTYHEALYVLSDLLVPYGSMDVMMLAKEFKWATQTFFSEDELVEAIQDELEQIGAEHGDINSYIYAMYCAIEEEIWNRLENIPENELVDILRKNGWKAMADHVEHLIEIDESGSEIEETKARRMNDTQYNINCCASSFNWKPLDQSFRSENHDQTLARVFEGAYRQYIDENYDGICDADKDTEKECSDTES